MRPLRLGYYLISLLFCLLLFSPAYAQTGGKDIIARTLTVNESLWNYNIYRQLYSGTETAHRVNHLGSGGALFDYQVNSVSIFRGGRDGNATLAGPLTVNILGIRDTNLSNALVFKWNENDTVDRVISWLVTSANRSITLSGDTVLDQDVSSTGAPTFATVDTGNGANELFAMNQDVETTDAPTFDGITVGPGTKHDGYVISDAAEVQTLDATEATLLTVTLLEGNTYLIEVVVTATQSDESASAVYKLITGAKRTTAGSAALFGSVVSIITSEEEPSWDCTFDASGNDIRVRVTGEGGTTIEWTCTEILVNGSI